MPFECAKSVATTFCWPIRHALTPVFGPDFPSTCTPVDSDKFGEMVIDPAVIRYCTEQANEYRVLENQLSSRASSTVATPITPISPRFPALSKSLHSRMTSVTSPTTDYATDSSTNTKYALSNYSLYRGGWTAANTPRSVQTLPRSRLDSPTRLLRQAYLAQDEHEPSIPNTLSPLVTQDNLCDRPMKDVSIDEDYDGDNSSAASSCGDNIRLPLLKRKRSTSPAERSAVSLDDEKAAFLLLSMRVDDGSVGSEGRKGKETGQGRMRRASA